MKKRTAILVDGAFFLKRYRFLTKTKNLSPTKTASELWNMCRRHLKQSDTECELYRIFYYDCLPYDKKQHNPISGKSIDFSKTPQYRFQNDFFQDSEKKEKWL